MKPYVIFGDITCGKTLSQFMEAMKQDFVVRGALMPDAHAGYSLPIGGVVMTKEAVVPAWVGYDIGCGVTVSRTTLRLSDIKADDYQAIYDGIRAVVPVGFNLHEQGESSQFLEHKKQHLKEDIQALFDDKALRSIGTLGGGNHFIEIGVDNEEYICISVHSGSRGFGHAVASYHMAKAANSDKAKEGHFAYTNSTDISNYMNDVAFCQWYATLNRYRMIAAVDTVLTAYSRPHNRNVVCNTPHNTVVGIGEGRFIHRKGATEALSSVTAPIPANMRDGIYLVVGKSNDDSLRSASHGAGRSLSRSKAKELITNDDFAKDMGDIVCNTSGKTDEAPAAYKPINEVMDAQKDCVSIVNIIKPLINVKG